MRTTVLINYPISTRGIFWRTVNLACLCFGSLIALVTQSLSAVAAMHCRRGVHTEVEHYVRLRLASPASVWNKFTYSKNLVHISKLRALAALEGQTMRNLRAGDMH